MLPTVVKAGATLALLAAMTAIALALLPVSKSVQGLDAGYPTSTTNVTCGSVLIPSGDDVLGDFRDRNEALACGSARTQRAGWAGTALGASIVILVFALLMGDGLAGGSGTPPREDRRSPDEQPAE
ncbi:hypothetical protein [Streptomyces sp. NBC_00083]|uniref:hypothetical protein n=1 Tax=Streptomyces sp. NBC_00083 TaxID=2975647 RepID=UPI00225BADBC|nr:hypothetical protein [Streptomyces sp. NBC_00083]MCX5387323.1 hypothetical protein [Streptomyces sp. NBC_00083]